MADQNAPDPPTTPTEGAVPEFDAFALALTPSGSKVRAVKKLYALLLSVDEASSLKARSQTLEKIARWVCSGPSPPKLDAASEKEAAAITRLRLLIRALDATSIFQARVERLVGSVLREASALRLLCEVGLPNDRGLWEETTERIARRLLPTPPDYDDLAELVARTFKHEGHADWLSQIPAITMADLHRVLGDSFQPLRDTTEDALALLATRVSALGLSEDIRRRGPGGPVRESPFYRLPEVPIEEQEALLQACRRDLQVVFENLERFGVSVDVVYRLEVITKCMDRIEAILHMLTVHSTPDVRSAEAHFVSKLVRARIHEGSVRDLVRSNMRLLARKVIERAGETGEHYITATAGEWWKMLFSACGGGFLTVFTCAARFITKWAQLAPAVDGLVSAANYASSFLVMQFCGFTLATKQPSMTAAALAGSIRERQDAHQLDDLVVTIARITRSQFAAALGNVGMVIPSAFAFDALYRHYQGIPFLDQDTANYTVNSFNPLTTGTAAFAALTGVLLWLSSLAAGWLENWAVFRRLPEAIEEHPIQRFIGTRLPRFFSRVFRKQIAGVGGSVALGFLLGMVPAFGTFFGLPLEVRHVTLSTGSLVLSLTALGFEAFGSVQALWAAVGILVIGLLNFGVSFMLALGVAFRAREVPLRQGLRLALAVTSGFLRSPFKFFLPVESGATSAHGPH